MRKGFVIVAILIVVTCAVHVRTLGHEFIIWDDDKNIYKNPYVGSENLEDLGEFWRAPYLGLYIPLTYTVWAMLGRISGRVEMADTAGVAVMDPFWFHFANVAIHAASTLLVLLLIYRFLGKRDLPAAALGTCLFAFHPFQVEPVAWATGMKDLLSTFLALVSMLLYFRYADLVDGDRMRRALVFYTLALGAFLLALLSKPSLVVLPVVLALIEFFVRGGGWKGGAALRRKYFFGGWRSPGVRLVPFLATAMVFTGITMGVQGHVEEALFPFSPPALWQRPVVALDAIGFYATKLVYPFQLVPEYGRTPDWALDFSGKFPLWLIPLIAGIAALRIREHRGYYFAAIGIALAGVAPVLGLVPFNYQGQSTVADRYMYLSMVGVALALATGLTFAKGRHWRWAAVAVATVLAVSAFLQAGHWKSSVTLFRHCFKVNPGSVAATYNYALASENRGRAGEALEYYRKAVELRPDFYKARNNLGNILNQHGRSKEAVVHLERAVEDEPDYVIALNNLGIGYANLGREEDAVAAYERALDIDPKYPEALLNLGIARMKREQFDEAMRLLERAAVLLPDQMRSYWAMGEIYSKRGQYAEAVRAYEEMVKRVPKGAGSHRLLAKAYARNGQFSEAERTVARALELARARPGMTEAGLEPLLHEQRSYANRVVPEE